MVAQSADLRTCCIVWGVARIQGVGQWPPAGELYRLRCVEEWTFDEIADESGFGDRERMRRAFLRAFGQSPQAIRRATQAQPVAV